MRVIKYEPFGCMSESESNKKDDVYFKMVETIATLSKDKNTQVGSLILDVNGKIVSMGYNGCPSKFGVYNRKDDSIVPHTRENQEIKLIHDYTQLGVTGKTFIYNKYPFMLHSEQNSILTTSDLNRLKGATIYCTHYPCSVCALLIAQAGIKTVKVTDRRHGTFEDTIVPTLFIYENMNINLYVYEKENK